LNELLYNYVRPERREAERDARLRRVEFGVLAIAGFLVAHYVFTRLRRFTASAAT